MASLRKTFRVFSRILLILGLLAASMPARPARADSDPNRHPDAARIIQLITQLSGETPFQTTRIYDRHGILLADIDDWGRRTIVGYNDIPECLIQATIATEDRRFFEHQGIDYLAIARAAWQNSQSETIVSGGSTITQQLARLLFMPPSQRYEQTITRKLKEAQLALDLEQAYTKEEILTMYLNMVYYGHQAYGAAAAAEVYFSKPLDQLTLGECALLAGLPQSPALYDPIRHPQAARQRQHTVLSLMVEAGYLTPDQAQTIRNQPIHLQPYQRPKPLAPHFVDYIRTLLIERYGTQTIHWGLQVHTSLDIRYQQLAQRIARAQVQQIGKTYRLNNAAVVILHPPTGQILAMVGSIDFFDETIHGQVNMTIEPRQPGSSIKPILYAAAFERGWSPASILWDQPVSYPLENGRRYVPHNITWRYYGPVRLRAALANSLNVPAVKLLHEVGIPAMLDTARRLGIRSWRLPQNQYGLSLAVGGYELPLLELTHAFATIANQGTYTPLHPVRWIEDGQGRIIYRADPAQGAYQAISPITAYQIASVLSDAWTRSLMFPRPSPLDTSQPTAVKTGTTDGWRDNLTVGFTSYLTVGVWTGNTDSKPMRKAVGVYTAGPIWHDIMEAIWANPTLHDTLGYPHGYPLPQGFTRPPEAITIPVCAWRPGRFNPQCPRMIEETFAPDTPSLQPGTRPRGYCLPSSSEQAPAQAYFLPLPKDRLQASRARDWMRNHFGLAAHDLNDLACPIVRRALVKQPTPPPPRQLIQLPSESSPSDKPASIAPTTP